MALNKRCVAMEHDIFFSISQTPDEHGHIPDEATMMRNYFQQLACADELGFGIGWIAQAHLSTETQKFNAQPVVPHWKGRSASARISPNLHSNPSDARNTSRSGVPSFPFSPREDPSLKPNAWRTSLSLHGLDENEHRCLHVGFSAGRFEFMARPYGIVPRNAIEEAAWPALRGQIFMEAAEIFLRLLRGDIINSTMIRPTVLTRANFRSDEDWQAVQDAAVEFEALEGRPDAVDIPSRYVFEDLKIVPTEFRKELLRLVAGTHDPRAQTFVNSILPVKVFNLSITSPEVIDATHERMREVYHPDGGGWKRGDMPRTSFVFLNAEEGLTPEEQSKSRTGGSRAGPWGVLERARRHHRSRQSQPCSQQRTDRKRGGSGASDG